MGKSKGKGRGKGAHQPQSFQQLVSKTQTENLKPYIHHLFQQYAQQTQQQLMGLFAIPNTRLTVLEGVAMKRFGLTKGDLKDLYADEEDKAWGYKESKAPAKNGDMLRVTVCGKPDKEKEFGQESVLKVRSLGNEPYQLQKELEEGLYGAKPGETRTIPITTVTKAKNKKGELEDVDFTYDFKITVDRISVLIDPPKAEAPVKGKGKKGATKKEATDAKK